jgi:PAS domain S-box-containing protein
MVEDDAVDRMAFERLVKAEGLPYDYTCVTCLADGKRALKSEDYDVVVTDYRLGDGNAFDLISEVPADIPIVLVTGAGGEEVAVQAMKAGASDYLIKDVDGNYLKTLPITVANTMKSKATERELQRYHEELERLVEERTLQLREKNEELSKEIEERKRAEEALRLAHDKLELRVEKRTFELRTTNVRLLEQIGERERAEKGLQKSKETVEAILNATSDCAFLLDTGGTFVALNQPTAEALQKRTDELVGQRYFDLIPQELTDTRRPKFNEVVNTGKAVRFEDRGMKKILDHSYHPVYESDGSVERVAVFSRDITEQKKAQESSVQKQRLAALGEMAGGVAHNFNNLLQIVIGACGVAEGDLELGDLEEVKSTLSQVVESAQMGSETVKQLQDFARVRTEDPTVDGEVFDLSATTRRAIQVSRPWWKSGPEKKGINLELRRKLVDGCYVKGHQNELFEVIVNLVKNATEAMPQGGKLYVKSALEDRHAVLQVRDNGMGISKDNLNKVFEPFWTTKGVQGTGMGLSTSFGIVTRHGGTISVNSWESKGTMFTIRLPLVNKPAEKKSPESVEKINISARVLLVDDQVHVAKFMERGLEAYGQTVFTASSGREGIEIFREQNPDMVICDLGMPDVNGWQVGKAVKEICDERGIAKTPFILLTGWGGQLEEREKIAECGVNRIIEKPVKYPILFDAMCELLQGDGKSRARQQ